MNTEPASLAAELRALSYDAHDVAGCVRVRLPLWCSVTIECERDRVRLVPRLENSPLSREGSVLAHSAMFMLLVGLLILVATSGAASPLTVVAAPSLALFAASSLVWLLGGVVQYILTESAIAAVRSLLIVKGTAQPAAAAVRGHA